MVAQSFLLPSVVTRSSQPAPTVLCYKDIIILQKLVYRIFMQDLQCFHILWSVEPYSAAPPGGVGIVTPQNTETHSFCNLLERSPGPGLPWDTLRAFKVTPGVDKQGQEADPFNAVCSQEAGQAQPGGPPDCVSSSGI